MTNWRKIILLIFVCFLILSFTFIPCTKIFYGKRKEIFLFTPIYILKSIELKDLSREYGNAINEGKNTQDIFTKITSLEKYRFKVKFFIKELSAIILILDAMYLLLCLIFIERKEPKIISKHQEIFISIWLIFSMFYLLLIRISRRNLKLFLTVQMLFLLLFGVYIAVKEIKKKAVMR